MATSIVEAGVDFSFRTGFRELASVLSLLQAAGRINRNGFYDNAEMWSFSMQDDKMLTQNIRQGSGTWQEVQKHSVSISRKALDKWRVKQITKEIYQWTLSYNSFLVYMDGVLNLEVTDRVEVKKQTCDKLAKI